MFADLDAKCNQIKHYKLALSNVDLSIGDLVYVPFANKILIGLVIEINVEQREDIVLKKVKQKIENILIKNIYLRFLLNY